MSKKLNYICPICGGREFTTIATVDQKWKVDANGNFLSEEDIFNDVIKPPSADNDWICCYCANKGVPLDIFSQDHNPTDLIFEIHTENGFKLKNTNSPMLYLAIWDTDDTDYVTVNYSVYDEEREFLDEGIFGHPQTHEIDTVADYDYLWKILAYILGQYTLDISKYSIRISNLDRLKDF